MKNKNFLKGLLSMAIAFSLLFSTTAGSISSLAEGETEQDSSVEIYGIQVNNFENPMGIDTAIPTFSWKLSSDFMGQKQTAYRIIVSKNEEMTMLVWDSGKIQSSDTTDILYSGENLEDCTRYYWQITVWDMNDNAVVSETAWFETAFINGSVADGANWLEVTDHIVGGEDVEYTVNYTIEADIINITKAANILFGTANRTADETAMWQIQDKGTYFRLVPHYWGYNSSNKLTWLTTGDAVNITSNSEEYLEMADGFHLEIRVNDSGVKTYIDDKLVATHSSENIGYKSTLGFVGLREATGEGVILDNLTVIDYLNNSGGAVLSALDFSDEADGTLHAVSDSTNNNWYGEVTLISGLTAAEKRTVDYTIDLDVLSITGTAGILFGGTPTTNGKAFMWQIQDKSTYFQIVPHYYDSAYKYLWRAVSNSTVKFATDTNSYAAIADGFHLQFHITDNFIETYIDGTLISTVTSTQLGHIPSLGYVGIRGATNESAVLDNLIVTDYMFNVKGDILADIDFTQMPVDMTNSNAIVENGVFSMAAGVNFGMGNFVTGLVSKSDTQIIPIAKKVHYTYEADISCSSVAASLCFNMKDANNFLMWQLGLTNTAVELRPHQVINGKYTAISKIDITEFVTPSQLQSGIKVKIEVTDTAILTYVNGEVINVFDTSLLSIELCCAKFGLRVATDENFTLDNVKAVNYFDTTNNGVLFNHSFETVNPFYRGKLIGGKLVLNSANDKGVSIIHNGTATFRKEFSAEKTVEKARLYITSYGVFNAYLNGERIGNKNSEGKTIYDELAPGWTDDNYRTCYYTYDITDYLQSGTNTLAVGVNYGWTGIKLYYSNEPKTPHKLLAKMVITYTDGTTEVIGTDNSWASATVGPVLSADIFQGEYYDATQDTSYRLNGYDISKWENAKEVTFNTTLTSRIGGQIYVREDLERAPKSIKVYNGITDAVEGEQYGKVDITATYGDEEFTLKAGETAVVDFGQNAAGWENITLDGVAGTHVVIRHAEMLNDNLGLISRGNDGPEGSVYVANLRNAPARTVYVMADGEQSYRPTATYYGFRYIEITATNDIVVKKIRGEVASSVVLDSGSFESSNQLLNQLYNNIKWGQYSNYFGQATDCPQRDERLGYSGDAQTFALTAMYNADVKAFIHNFMQTLVEGQANDGGFPNTMPGKAEDGSVWAGVAGFADAGIIIPHTYYKQYSDKAFLEEYYDAMVKYMDYLANIGAERIGQKFGDWLAYEDSIINYISYVYTIWDAQMMQEIAAVLGKTDDVKKFAEMEQTYLAYFRELYLDENGDLTATTQTAYLFALKLGLYETEEAWLRGKAALVEKIKNNGNKLTTGFMGTSIIMETLVEIGEQELAYELLFQEDNPSWLYSVKQGATTIWERWNSYSLTEGFGPVNMNSFNHYAFGSVGDYFYTTILGINPDDVGYKTILLNPIPTEKLEFAKGSYDSVNGLIESSWAKNDNGSYRYSFTVPMNTTATVKLKKQAYSTYYVNGVRFDKLNMSQNGAEYLGSCDGVEIFAVTSGKFDFTVKTAQKLYVKNTDGIEKFDFDVTGLSEYVGKVYTASGKAWYTFTTEETGIVEALNSKFNFYYNRESVYNQRDIFTNGDTADTYAGNGNYESRWILLYNDFLQRQGSKKYGEIFRKIDSLVPKTTLGNEVYVKNFQTSYDIRFESEEYGAVILGFRQQTPGKYCSAIYKLVQNQAFVALGRKGITIASGNDIVSGKNAQGDMYNAFQTAVFDTPLPQEVTVKVRVVDNECTVEIYERSTLNLLYSFAEELSYNEAGSIAYSVSTVGHDIGNIELTALDANGDICDIAIPYNADSNILAYKHGKITVTDVNETDDGFVYELTSDVDDGWYIKAKSVKVEDENGNVAAALPVASNRFELTADGGAVTAEFYKVCDINYDNDINVKDLVRLKKVMANDETDTSVFDADCNCDGSTDAYDLTVLREKLLNK